MKSGEADVTANYDVTVVDGALTIRQNPEMKLAVSLEGRSYVYDGTAHFLPAAATTNASTGTTTIEYSADGKFWAENLSGISATGVADSCTVRVRASNPNYANTAEGTAELTVTPREAVITIDNASKIQGEDDPAFTGTVEGLVAEGDLGEVRYVRTNGDEAPGTYEGVLTATYAANANYDVSVTKGDFTIRALLTVKWLDVDSSALQTKTYGEGDEPPAYDGKTPTKAATAQYTYAFTGWDDGTVDGTVTTYKPLFSETVNEYTVRFVNDGGTELQSGKVAYGQTPEYKGKVPTKADTAQYTYAFKGWDKEIAAVTGDATYTATYTQTVKKGTLTFDCGGGTIGGKASLTIEANVGDTIAIPEAPVRDGYAFKYWKGSEYYPGDKYTVEGDHAFTAVWEKKPDSGGGGSGGAKGSSAKTGDAVPAAALGALAAAALLALAVALAAGLRARCRKGK